MDCISYGSGDGLRVGRPSHLAELLPFYSIMCKTSCCFLSMYVPTLHQLYLSVCLSSFSASQPWRDRITTLLSKSTITPRVCYLALGIYMHLVSRGQQWIHLSPRMNVQTYTASYLRKLLKNDAIEGIRRDLVDRSLQAAPEFGSMPNLTELPAYRFFSLLDSYDPSAGGQGALSLTPQVCQPDPTYFFSESPFLSSHPNIILLYGETGVGSVVDGGIFFEPANRPCTLAPITGSSAPGYAVETSSSGLTEVAGSVGKRKILQGPGCQRPSDQNQIVSRSGSDGEPHCLGYPSRDHRIKSPSGPSSLRLTGTLDDGPFGSILRQSVRKAVPVQSPDPKIRIHRARNHGVFARALCRVVYFRAGGLDASGMGCPRGTG